MPDYVPIQDLTIVNSIGNNDLFPLSDGSGAYAVRGSTIKSYAATDAAAAAADAALSKTAAQNAAADAAAAQSAAEAAQAAAEEAVDDAEVVVEAAERMQAGIFNAFISADFSPSITQNAYINSNTGKTASSSSGKYARTGLWNGYGYRIAVELANNTYEYAVFYYDENGNVSSGAGYLGYGGYKKGLQYIPQTAILFALTFHRVDDAALSSSDITAITAALKAYIPTDRNLETRGIAADAKATGDGIETAVVDVSNMIDGVENVVFYEWEHGKYVPTAADVVDPTARANNSEYSCCVIPCAEGDVICFYAGNTGSSARPINFIDSSNNVIWQKTSATEARAKEGFVAPKNTAYAVLNTRNLTSSNNPLVYFVFKGHSKAQTNRNAIDAIENYIRREDIYAIEEYQWEKGAIRTYAASVDITDNRLWQSTDPQLEHAIIPCESYDEFYIYAINAATNFRPWSFINDEGTVLDQATSNSASGVTRVAPLGATKLVVNAGENSSGQMIHRVVKIPPLYSLFGGQKIRSIFDNIYKREHFCLIHFSDIHEDGASLKRIVALMKAWPGYYDDAIHTGDYMKQQYSDSMDFWDGVSGAEKILGVIGNHETAERIYDPVTGELQDIDWYAVDEADTYAKFIGPYIANWGGVTYTEGKCYYYKDYDAKHIRLIVLDAMHFTADQLTWFTGLLTSAKTAGMHVIVAGHFRAGFPETRPPIAFNDYWQTDSIGTPTRTGDLRTLYPADYEDAVQDFIDAGGNFICWIGGHLHYDLVSMSEAHPDQLQICIAKAGAWTNTGSTPYRTMGHINQDCINLMAISTSSKFLSIIRVGHDRNKRYQYKDQMCYDYGLHKIVVPNGGTLS